MQWTIVCTRYTRVLAHVPANVLTPLRSDQMTSDHYRSAVPFNGPTSIGNVTGTVTGASGIGTNLSGVYGSSTGFTSGYGSSTGFTSGTGFTYGVNGSRCKCLRACKHAWLHTYVYHCHL